MKIQTAPYSRQVTTWPPSGRHIMAQYDDSTIVVYQAFRPSIADFALKNQRFGGEFSFGRMTWFKPNFLWMMFRCGWATKTNQERVLALRLERSAFDQLLSIAVHSAFTSDQYASPAQWAAALQSSRVRLQWDPDHDPSGKRVDRRALQLAVPGEMLHHPDSQWLIEIEDLTGLVEQQRENAATSNWDALLVPRERVYVPQSQLTCQRLGLAQPQHASPAIASEPS